MRISEYMFSGLIMSFLLVGIVIGFNSSFIEYDKPEMSVGNYNKTQEFETQITDIKDSILDSGTDSTINLIIIGFQKAPDIFKSFLTLIEIYTSLIQNLTMDFGFIIVPGWVTALLISVIMLGLVLAVLGLFIERDRI